MVQGFKDNPEFSFVFLAQTFYFIAQILVIQHQMSDLGNARIIWILTWIALSLFSTLESMATPCSVKAIGGYFACCPLFKVTFCDLKARSSSRDNSNMKSSGKRSVFLRTACFNTLVSTP